MSEPIAPSSPASQRRALIFIIFTAFLNSTGFGIILPVMPALIADITGEGIAVAAQYGGMLLVVYAVMQFLVAPIIGNLSDRFGRRPVMLISLVAFGLDYLLMGFAPTLAWLFVGRLIAGAAGATFATSNAFIADITPADERPQRFGLLGMAFGLGFIFGPVIGGLLGELGPRMPFFAAGILALANATFGFFAMPESLAPEHRRPFSWARANALGALMQIRAFPGVLAMACAYFLYQLAHHVLPSTWSFYTIEKFAWSQWEIGMSLAFVGVMMALVQGLLIRWAIPKFGVVTAGTIGFAATAIGFVGYAFAGSAMMMYVFLAVASLQGLTTPALQGLMTRDMPPEQQGGLQGALSSMNGLGAVIGPLVMTQLFAYFSSAAAPVYFPGAAFLLAAVLTVLALALFTRTAVGARAAQPSGI